jgi:hypothetical protein
MATGASRSAPRPTGCACCGLSDRNVGADALTIEQWCPTSRPSWRPRGRALRAPRGLGGREARDRRRRAASRPGQLTRPATTATHTEDGWSALRRLRGRPGRPIHGAQPRRRPVPRVGVARRRGDGPRRLATTPRRPRRAHDHRRHARRPPRPPPRRPRRSAPTSPPASPPGWAPTSSGPPPATPGPGTAATWRSRPPSPPCAPPRASRRAAPARRHRARGGVRRLSGPEDVGGRRWDAGRPIPPRPRTDGPRPARADCVRHRERARARCRPRSRGGVGLAAGGAGTRSRRPERTASPSLAANVANFPRAAAGRRQSIACQT